MGVYTVVPGDYWYGGDPTGQSGTADQDTRQPLLDDWLTPQSTLAGTAAVGWLDPAEEVDLRLNRAVVGVDAILRLGTQVQGFIEQPTPPEDPLGR